MDLAQKIRKIRTDRGISQVQFAKDIGISRAALFNYEKGLRTPPIDILLKIAEKFDIDIDTLTSNNDIELSKEESKVLEEHNLLEKFITIESESMSIEDLLNFLDKNGYPAKDLSAEQIIELYKNATQFFNYEFFKLGYIKVSDINK